MNVEIGTEGVQCPEKEYIRGIFVAVCTNIVLLYLGFEGVHHRVGEEEDWSRWEGVLPFLQAIRQQIHWARIYKRLRTPGNDSMESIPYKLSLLFVVMEQLSNTQAVSSKCHLYPSSSWTLRNLAAAVAFILISYLYTRISKNDHNLCLLFDVSPPLAS